MSMVVQLHLDIHLVQQEQYLTLRLIHELKRQGKQFGVVTMCIGGGMGAAGVFELLIKCKLLR